MYQIFLFVTWKLYPVNALNYRNFKQYHLTGIYDDRILNFTNNWVSTNDLCILVKGDKAGIITVIKLLLSRGDLETRTMDTKIEYKRIDKEQNQEDFKPFRKIKLITETVDFSNFLN